MAVIIRATFHMAAKDYVCEGYIPTNDGCNRRIKKGDRYLRTFGSGDIGETPYELLHCLPCAKGIAKHDPSVSDEFRERVAKESER